ncbi:MAG TPA: hypothetical protein VKM72_26575 [Thermoanaerobaculia bacterium]|nr:hypothetical protein [Thermoanaerobaculia bacterium]
MLADLPAYPLHGLLRERWSLLDRYGDPQWAPLHDPDFARYGLDFDPPL